MSIQETTTDFIGQEIRVKDIVAMSMGSSAYLQFGRVKKITPKGCTVEYGSRHTYGKKKGELHTKACTPSQIVKINGEDAVMLALQGKLTL